MGIIPESPDIIVPALVALIVALLATWRSRTEGMRAAHRQLLGEELHALSENMIGVLATTGTYLQKVEGGARESELSWIDRAAGHSRGLKEAARRTRYTLRGLDQSLRTLALVPHWVQHSRSDPPAARLLLRSATRLRQVVDWVIWRSYRTGRPPSLLARIIVRLGAWGLDKKRNQLAKAERLTQEIAGEWATRQKPWPERFARVLTSSWWRIALWIFGLLVAIAVTEPLALGPQGALVSAYLTLWGGIAIVGHLPEDLRGPGPSAVASSLAFAIGLVAIIAAPNEEYSLTFGLLMGIPLGLVALAGSYYPVQFIAEEVAAASTDVASLPWILRTSGIQSALLFVASTSFAIGEFGLRDPWPGLILVALSGAGLGSAHLVARAEVHVDGD